MLTTSTIGARLDNLAVGRFHWRLLGLVTAGMFFDSFDLYIAGAVLGALVQSGESTLQLNAMFISATFLGMMVGAWLSGVLGDRYGRRFSYQFNLLVYGGASLAGALAPSMGWLIVARLVMGVGLGAEIVVGYATISEFVPARHRGRFGTLVNVFINTSLFLSTIAGWVIIPRFGWRWMFVIVAVGACIVWFLRKSVPESPRWLAAQGREREAEAVLNAIEAECGVTPSAPPPAQGVVAATPGRTRDLFAPGLAMRTFVGITVLVALFTVNFGFVSWIPTFLVKQGHSVSNSLGLSALMFAGGPIGSIIGLLLAERLGRKWGLVLFSLIGIVISIAYAYATSNLAIGALGFVVTLIIYVLSSLSVATYVPELFPTELRLRGTGLCNAVGRAVNIGVPYAVAAAFAGFGLLGVVVLMSGVLLLQAIIVGTVGIETRQRSLEELAVLPGRPGATHLSVPAEET